MYVERHQPSGSYCSFLYIFLATYRGPGPLEAQTPGDDPLVRGEGQQQEPGRGLPPRHPEGDACVTGECYSVTLVTG